MAKAKNFNKISISLDKIKIPPEHNAFPKEDKVTVVTKEDLIEEIPEESFVNADGPFKDLYVCLEDSSDRDLVVERFKASESVVELDSRGAAEDTGEAPETVQKTNSEAQANTKGRGQPRILKYEDISQMKATPELIFRAFCDLAIEQGKRWARTDIQIRLPVGFNNDLDIKGSSWRMGFKRLKERGAIKNVRKHGSDKNGYYTLEIDAALFQSVMREKKSSKASFTIAKPKK